MKTQTNKRAIGKDNELKALKAIGNAGWLTTTLIAKWCYMTSTLHSAINQAQAVTKRLESKGMIKRRETPAGVTAWILTTSGADYLNCHLEYERNEEGWKGWAHDGYDLGFLEYQRHVTVCDYLAKWLNSDKAEDVIAKARMRVQANDKYFRQCDALIITNSGDDYTITGVLAVSNASATSEERIRLASKKCDRIELICEPAVRKRLMSKLGQ